MVVEVNSEEMAARNLGFYIERGIVKEDELLDLNSNSVSYGMNDDEILAAAAKITAKREVEAEEIRSAEDELTRKKWLFQKYLDDNLPNLGIISYFIQGEQIVAFTKSVVGRERRFSVEIFAFSDSETVINVGKVSYDRETALAISESLNRALRVSIGA